MLTVSGASKHATGHRAAPQQKIRSPPKSVAPDLRYYSVKRKAGVKSIKNKTLLGLERWLNG